MCRHLDKYKLMFFVPINTPWMGVARYFVGEN